jgi:hypothetical protein
MDYASSLPKLETLLSLVEQYMPQMYQSSDEHKRLYQQICTMYGEVADVVEAVVGRSKILVRDAGGEYSVYPNFIEAGFLSSRTTHTHQGYTELLKVIGKVRDLAGRSAVGATHATVERSVADLIRTLNRFRECCQYLPEAPRDERDVQNIIWMMVRSQFDGVDREDTLPKFGVKNYRPDFGIPELKVLIEVKFIGQKTVVSSIQEEIMGDVPGYLSDSSRYEFLIVFVYDGAHPQGSPKTGHVRSD